MDIVSCDLLQWIARIENGLKLRPTTRYTVKVKKSSPKSLSANCWPTVYNQLTDSWPTVNRHLKSWEVEKCTDIAVTRPLPFYLNQSHHLPQIGLKLHHRMSWISLSMKSPYNALWIILARHICTFNSPSIWIFFWLIFSVNYFIT